jgi:hypothetical protein
MHWPCANARLGYDDSADAFFLGINNNSPGDSAMACNRGRLVSGTDPQRIFDRGSLLAWSR